MKETQSHIQLYSIGIVSANKHLDSDTIYAVPIEVTPYGEGELDSEIEQFEGKGKDRHEEDYEVSVNHDSSVEAIWLRDKHTNRRTSPDVRRGERVMLYRHSDSGAIFWDSMGMDDHLRKLETVIYSWSDTQDEALNSTEPENCYQFEICTHTKQITLQTVKADEEPYEYTYQFNTGEGIVLLTDDVKNFFQLDSPETCWTIKNKDGSYGEWNKREIMHYGPDSVTVEDEDGAYGEWRGRNVKIYGPDNVKIFDESGAEIELDGPDITIRVPGTLRIEANGVTTEVKNGNIESEINKDVTTLVKGSTDTEVKGSTAKEVGGSAEKKIGGSSNTQVGGSIDTRASSSINTQAGGVVNVKGSNINLN